MNAAADEQKAFAPAPSEAELIERVEAKRHRLDVDALAADLARMGSSLEQYVEFIGVLAQNRDGGKRREVHLLRMEEERTADVPERVWFVDGMITSGFNLIIAKKAIGKSFFVLDMAVAIAGGDYFLGRSTTETGVLYVPTELDRIAMHERIQEFGKLPENLFIHYSWSTGQQALTDAENVLRSGFIKVLIFDMFLPIVPEVETNAYESSAVYLRWRQLAQKYEAALICLWHSGKAVRADFMDAAIGTTGLIGQSDSIISLDRKRGEAAGKLFIGGNHGTEAVIKVFFENRHWHLVAGDGEDFLSTGDTELLELVNTRGQTTPTTAAAVTGRTYDAVRVALAGLYERGVIEKTGRGIYAPKEPKKTEDLRSPSESENRSEAKVHL